MGSVFFWGGSPCNIQSFLKNAKQEKKKLDVQIGDLLFSFYFVFYNSLDM